MSLLITCPSADLSVKAEFLDAKAPENIAFLRAYLATPRHVPGLHAMWTGPEISCPIPPPHLAGAAYAQPLPPENATLNPQPGDIVLAYIPARVWGGNPDPIFDIGLFYGPGARMLFPIGWHAGSVIAQVRPEDRASLADACNRIRRSGACEITFALEP
ncbi:hypothetical protein GCM10010873_09210 [Cypionkella aquatica]|uniref:DUF3830 family protein n=1 Tax=Cypionkella aquatica TaxID=1756042 RepID=A0AA37TWE5_9RHOB|nr:DUF3830 family protein [Cypionkella aquatica]GLS85947.1 hypothetical protein GCM10010873_09210 [Cypionkella aquatica]